MTLIDAEVLVDTKSRSYRMKHIDLSTPCVVETNKKREYSTVYRNALAEYTGTTLPEGHEYHACHACNNGACKNPQHIYWGTPEENQDDLLQYYYQSFPEKVGQAISRREMMKAMRLQEFDNEVAKGNILIPHDMSQNQIEYRDAAIICDVIEVKRPENNENYYAYYTLKRKNHKLATPKLFSTNLRETTDFHKACVFAITMHYANHIKKEKGLIPSELAEQWVRMWDSGMISTKEDLYRLYEDFKPGNLIIMEK